MSKTNIMERLDCLIVCTVYSLCARVILLCTDLICSLDATSRYAHIVIGHVLKNGCVHYTICYAIKLICHVQNLFRHVHKLIYCVTNKLLCIHCNW